MVSFVAQAVLVATELVRQGRLVGNAMFSGREEKFSGVLDGRLQEGAVYVMPQNEQVKDKDVYRVVIENTQGIAEDVAEVLADRLAKELKKHKFKVTNARYFERGPEHIALYYYIA